jgi:predicted Holliday junction resolvase-like endonuclease
MARQNVDIGVQGNDGTGDSIREAFRKVNDNFRDLYAVFGNGDLIKSTGLDDFPNSYASNQILVVNDAGDAFLAKDVTGGEGITIDNTSENEMIISASGAKLSADTRPSLGAPLNANTLSIGKLGEPSDAAVTLFNSVHGTTITIDDLAIPKGYADRRYLQSGGGSSAGQIRIRTEPTTQAEYTKTINSYQNGNIRINNHGYDSGSDGIAFKYYSTGNTPPNLVEGTTYYLRYVNVQELSVHPTFDDARENTNRITIASGSGSGVQTLVDAYLDTTIPGNFLSNEALPRVSTVRRSGDVMTGPLYLDDHPSPLNVNPIPDLVGADTDFQAATKYYVDNNSFASNINLFVATSGDDSQANTPAGKEGRAYAYAYSTIGAACARAVELIELAANEPGPYRQKLAYTIGLTTTISTVQTIAFAGGTGYTAVQDLLELNREYIRAEVIGYINTVYPDLKYNADLCSRDVGIIIDAVIIDTLVNGNWQSVNAGRSYFKNASARVASGIQQIETVAGIVYAKTLADYVLQKVNPPTSYQSVYTRRATGINSNSTQRGVVGSKFDIVIGIIQDGISSAPTIDYGPGYVTFTVDNGGAGNVDQGNPVNVDITPGKIVRGISSGAVARVVSYTPASLTDTITCQLLTPYNFVVTEEIEFGEPNKNLQITIRPESGIYYEDYPIRVPANVTIRGDDFRRTIVRPKDRASQSPWIETYFYRDTTFDGIDLATTLYPHAVELLTLNKDYLKREVIAWIASRVAGNLAPFTTSFTYNEGKCSRDVGLIVDALIQDIKFGGNASTYEASALYYNGVTSKIAGQEAQTAAAINQLKTIVVNYVLTNTAYSSLQVAVAQSTTATNGEAAAITKTSTLMTSIASVVTTGLSALPVSYDNPKYGYHYLKDSSRVMNVGASYTNAGGYVNAAKLIEINKAYIQAEVNAFVLAYAGVVTYDQVKSIRDTGYIVDAVVADLRAGGKANVVDIASRFWNSSALVTQAACVAGINHIATIAQRITQNLAPITTYQTTVTRVVDTSIVRESASSAVIDNLVDTVLFAFDPAYNPPKNANEVDAFLFNDAVRISNITGQAHGGFMCVLDPAGSIGSKSPYVQESASFSKSLNRQAFSGGMFIDGFSGRLKTKITATSGAGLVLELSGLTYRRPIAPTAFYYNGFRYQVDNVKSWNPTTGAGTIELNPTTPWSLGNLNIVLETPGNRSMLANDYTQVNDLGYGIVAHNTGLTEQVSTFTYYCWTAYFASYGGQIRGVAGSNANGQYGLRAVGADPTEIPDQVSLAENMTQVAKIYRYDDYSGDNQKNDIELYIKRYSYIPSSISEIEIDHLNGTIGRYELRTVTRTGLNDSQYTYRITGVTKASTAVVTVHGTLPLTVLGISRASPASVTVSGSHGLVDGDFVTITGVTGMTQINNGSYYIKSTGASTFTLFTDKTLIPELDSINFTAWASGGVVESPIKFYSGDRVLISGVGGMTQLNGNKYYVKPLTYKTFELYSDLALTTPINSTSYTTYTSGGVVNEKFTYTINAITKASPAQVTFTESHHYSDGDLVKIDSVGGMIQITGLYYVKKNGANTVQLYQDPTLVTPVDSTTFTTYTSGGTMFGGKEILLLSVSTGSNDNREANGLVTQLSDSMNISIRELQNFRFTGVENVNPTRPSTALEFDATLPTVYRIISYGTTLPDGSTLPPNEAVLSSDTSFIYIKPTTDPTKISTTDPVNGAKKMGSQIGDTRIAIYEFSGDDNATKRDLLNTGTLTIAWNGKIHRITGYTAASGLVPPYITIADSVDNNNYGGGTAGINKAFSTASSTTLRAGLPAGSTAAITVKISTCRVTGHDFLDIGTGGYNTTNYPTAIFGNPTQGPTQENEVIEELKGRVFYVSTDQNGIFRVGRFFTVDQGTGTVTFSASIALSNLDGIGFKRGVTVAEFSTDATMTNNAADTVPVQSAIRGYIDKRLGLDHSGNNVPVPNLIGPGYLPLSGVLAMKGILNQGGYKIQNLGAPAVNDDATTKLYVDQRVGLYDQLSKQGDVEVFAPASADLLVFTGGGTNAISATASGDISATLTSTNSTTLVGGITNTPTIDSGIAGTSLLYVSGGIVVDDITGFPASGYIRIDSEVFHYTSITTISNRFDGITRAELTTVAAIHAAAATVIGLSNAQVNLQINPLTIVNADVSATAGIKQSKLDMDNATANTALLAVKGVASFDNANFETDGGGFVSIKAGGVALTEIANIGNGSILGNFSGSASRPIELTAATVGAKTLESLFSSNGALTRTSSETFAVVGITTNGANNSLVKTSSTGTIDVKGLSINGNSVLTIASTTVNVSTPGGVNIISATGSNSLSTPVTLLGQYTLGANATLEATFADLAEYYTSDKEYEPGTVLIFGGDAETTTTNIFGDVRLAGVVSTDPGFKMNGELKGTRVCLALQGRVPCKVVGKVKKGDMLTTAGVIGHAAKAMDPKVGTIIGKALQDKDYTEAGVIEVAVGRV